MRVSGLATGMDTESIIRDMMTAHRLPLDKITQRKQYLEWQLDDYRGINRNLKSLSDKLFDTVMRQRTYTEKQVSVSNENAVSIRNINSTTEFSGTLQIHQLATSATWQSGKLGEDISEDAEISKLNLGGNSIIITAPTADGKTKTETITFESNESIKTVLNRINQQASVNAFFDSQTGKIAMIAKNSGEGNIEVKIGDEASTKGEPGQNAEFTFNGLKTNRSSNTFQINGFEITLKQVTAPYEETTVQDSGNEEEVEQSPIVAPSGETITFSSSPDTEKIIESVVKFVDDYNKLIEELNAKVKEPKYRSFHPLSDEQKAEMKEKEIELWEEKAMSGTLRNDATIQSLLQKMRSALNASVKDGNTDLYLSDIGITTSKNYLDNGKLIIDENKLREIISEDPNKVYKVLGQSSDNDNERGLVGRLRTAIDDTRKVITERAGNTGAVNDTFTLGRTLKQMDNQIERFQTRMQQVEDRYWKQFTRMEMAIQRANAQSAQLMSAFGGMM